MPPASAEHRAHPRVALKVVVDLESENNLYTGVAGDVSEGGVFVATHDPPPSGSVVRVHLVLPDVGTQLDTEGLVRWIRSPSASCEGMPPGCGIAWRSLPTEARSGLQRFASRREPLLFEP